MERPGQKGRDFVTSESRGYIFVSPHKARARLTMVVVFIRPQGLRTGAELLGSGGFASACAYIILGLPFRGVERSNTVVCVVTGFQLIRG